MDLNEILKEAVQLNASDIHIAAFQPPIFRINGKLVKTDNLQELGSEQIKTLLLNIIDEHQKNHLFAEKELDFSYSLPGISRFRVNYFFQRNSLSAAFRVIKAKIATIEELRLPPQIKEFAAYPRGLVLVTGPTGSGKSTTLAAIIDLINENRVENIITIEDPIEYLYKHKKSLISQREVGSDTKSFANALKYVLREDPDIILVGEMRDLETISSALTAAETGHLVFSTLHTQDAAQTLDRVVDIFPPHQQQQVRIQLSGTLKAVLVQQLIPTIDNQGRVPAVELMFSNVAIRNLIREMKTHQIYSAIQSGGRRGMITMDMSLADLYRKGLISREIALEKCHHREDMERMLG